MSFYHTIPQSDNEKIESEKTARNQEYRIFSFMERNGRSWTAWELKNIFSEMEITSIRRALWNLEYRDKTIEQVGWQVPGPKGVKVGKYKAIFKTTLF